MAKLHIWHRYVGITAALFVIILSITGLVLNFNDRLQLDQTHLHNTWLLDHYNIGSFPVTSFQLQTNVVSKASDYVYLDGMYALNLREDLVGAIKLEKDFLLATQSSLLLIDQDGQIIEEIGTYSGLPEKPLGIAITINGFPVIRGINTYWKGSKTLAAWQPLQGPHPKWVAPIETPKLLNEKIQQHARSHEISLERIFLDLHSGRLLGGWGQNIMSAAAVLLLILAITGTILWMQKK